MSDGIGYLTPDVVQFGSVTECRTVTLPLSLWYLANGALQELTRAENWVQFGTATPDETAAFFLNALDELSKCHMIGSIIMLATQNYPENVLPCDGATYARADYPELWDVLDPGFRLIVPADHFIVPDLRGRFLLAEGNGRSLGYVGGEETHSLTISEIPEHTHDYVPPAANIDLESPGFPDIVAAGVGLPTKTSISGGGNAHNNMPPFYTVKYGIVAK